MYGLVFVEHISIDGKHKFRMLSGLCPLKEVGVIFATGLVVNMSTNKTMSSALGHIGWMRRKCHSLTGRFSSLTTTKSPTRRFLFEVFFFPTEAKLLM